MSALDWPLITEVLLKLGLAALLGAIVGLEREVHGRPAGIRTHMLLVIGVTLFSEVSKNFSNGDEGRIAAQIVTGVGFLGAGTILRLGAEIKGLTTAASLWAVSAIGMAVSTGGSFMFVAVVATLLSVFTLAVVDNIQRRLVPDAHPRALMVNLKRREALSDVIERIEMSGGRVLGTRLTMGENGLQALLDLQGRHGKIMAAATQCEDVESATWAD